MNLKGAQSLDGALSMSRRDHWVRCTKRAHRDTCGRKEGALKFYPKTRVDVHDTNHLVLHCLLALRSQNYGCMTGRTIATC